MHKLSHYPLAHGGIRKVIHPRLQTEIDNQTAIRYLRFVHPVQLDHLELPRSVYGRWTPAVPTHPARLLISIPDRTTRRWRLVQQVDLPCDPRTAGEGLNQSMPMEELEAHFAAILNDPPYRIDLNGLQTDILRVECDLEHPVFPNHGECNGSPFSVPFGILEPLQAYGIGEPPYRHGFAYLPGLRLLDCRPSAPIGMTVTQTPLGIFYQSPTLAIGFSLKRPQLIYLGWDAFGREGIPANRLKSDLAMGTAGHLGGLSGPLLRTFSQDFGAHAWTGEVSVRGNVVEYRHLHAVDGFTIDARFTIEPDGLSLELRQNCTAEISLLEAETWRFAWDLCRGMTAAAAVPALAPGRNGEVHLPLAFAADGLGCLVCRPQDEGENSGRAQVESYRVVNTNTCGFYPAAAFAARPEPESILTLQPGESRLTLRLELDAFTPRQPQRSHHAGEGLQRHWGSVFACFRPEHRGFSNNAASVNCHLSQAVPIDIIANTGKLACGLDPADLSRFTLKRALLDGGGYGYWRNLYLDSDPALLIAAGTLHRARPDRAWLRSIEPGLIEVTARILDNRDDNGLVICRDLSGNSGSYRWSCNGMDVIGFGNLDAYVNAKSYHALRNARAMFASLGKHAIADRCEQAAEEIKAAYAPVFLNPATGWIAGWRSRDGILHDYGFLWINGPAIAYGLLEPEDARRALQNLEAARAAVGATEGYLGLPANLYPIDAGDHMMPIILSSPTPTFEQYIDGGYSGHFAAFYLRALSIYGFKEAAARLADELEAGYAAGYHHGSIGEGTEFRTWSGLQTGYEGTLIGNFTPMYALAVERGWIQPPEPEWWE